MLRAEAIREIILSIRQKQMRFLGQVIRDGKLEENCVTGRIEEKCGRGKLRLKYMGTLSWADGGGLSAVELIQIGNSRTQWRSIVDNVL